MKNNLLTTIYMLSKYFLYGFVLQLLLFNFGLPIQAKGQYKKIEKVTIKLSEEKLTVDQFFKEVQAQTPFVFSFDSKKIDRSASLAFTTKQGTVEGLLKEASGQSNLSFRQINHSIDVKVKERSDAPVIRDEDQITVAGTVTDANGDPLPGVTVSVLGTTIGTATDLDGVYSLSVPDGSTLVFSFIGFQSQTVEVGGRSVIDVVMREDLTSLDEVVVVGYGTQRREEITSSIATVSEEDFNKGAITQSPLQLVQGKIAGLAISRAAGGDPTAGVDMQLRGVSTVRGEAAPLVIIDGVPGGNINTLSPEDIASINVLRDGSAAAIYGTRGNAGVIIITTHKGTPGKAAVKYSSYVYTETWLNKPEILDAEGWRQMRTNFENSSNSLLQGKAGSIVDFGHDTDWLDEITRPALSQVHNLSMSGGSENTNYYGSVNYRDLQGFIRESDNNILNGRLSLTHIGMDGRLNVQMNLSNTFRKGRPVNYNVYRQAMQRNPTLPVYNEDGSFHETAGYDTSNPLGMLLQYDQEEQFSEVLASTRVSYEVLPNLTVSGTGALQRSNQITGYYEHRDAFASINGGYNGQAQRTAGQNIDRTLESSVEYSNLFDGIHSLNVLGGYSYQDFTSEGFGARNRDFITNFFSYHNLGAGLQLPDGKYLTDDVYSNKESNKVIAFFGRVNYNYQGKYMLSASMRKEGSTRFGENNKWGLFPAISAGWTISSEEFMSNVKFVDDLKLRIGYGITGNQGIGNYISQQRLGNSGVMLYNGNWIPGYAPASNPNPDLRWETKAETNIGIDATLFNEAVTVTLDVYNRKTSDLLYEYAVPVPPNLYNTIWTNIGEMTNKGIELAVATTVAKTSKFSWDVDFNISYNKNELVTLSNEKFQTKYQNLENIGAPGLNDTPAFRLQEGQPIGNFFGYQFAGFTEEGKWLFWDATRTNQLLASEVKEEDKAILGNGLPKSYAGLTNTLRYGNFDLTVFFRGAFAFDLLNTRRIFYENRIMVPVNVMTAALESPVIDDPQYSDYYIERGDFVKLDNVTLGYSVPLRDKKIKGLRVYASGQNLYTFTGYKGQDPEIRINGLTPGMDYRWIYPSVRTFTLGVNVQF